MRGLLAATALALVVPGAALTQPPAPAAAPEPDAHAVEVARRLLLIMIPPAQREQMMSTIAVSMMQNMMAGVRQAAGEKSDPRKEEIVNRFLVDAEADVKARLSVSLPSLFEAYARAYARNFTTQDMEQILAFVSTPAGQKFALRSQFLVTDADVQSWQKNEVADSFRRMGPRIAEMQKEIAALNPKTETKQ